MPSPRRLCTRTTLFFGLVVALVAPSHAGIAATELSQEQALDAARRHILADEDETRPETLDEYAIVPLDAQAWGKRYFAFHFPRHGNAQYHVSKVSGFVQPIVVVTGPGTSPGSHAASAAPAPFRDIAGHLPALTLSKAERWSDYVIMVTFPESLAAELEAVGFGCQLWQPGENLPPFHHQEFKNLLSLKSVNHVRALTLTISKSEAARFPIVDVFLFTANTGTHLSSRIADIPDRKISPPPSVQP